ncbi:uncharacterized protein LOC116608996 [Nematostella vectensis]|uniref:uncharacterized protein LOC116608996 n=1 Tax=Nematostella vectensis TaxID=45351 RepID=UPI00207771E1|nr:uncharacterized protein LOC116608996 [Nematostella vectensis]
MAERPNAPAPISENIPENIESFPENIIPHQSVEPETTTLRSRTMAEKGLEYAKELKAKTAKAATDHFRQVTSDFLAHLSSSNNKDQILKELSHCNALAESATTKLNDFYDLIKETPDSQEVADSQLDIHQSINEAKKIAHEKITTLEYQADKMSVISSASHSSRKSSKSPKSARDTLIDVRAKRAALEEKIKFNNSILEQEQKLANLKLQQELNATKAEEAVYKEAISLEEFGLPIEKENLISRFLSEAQTTKPVITDPIQSCLSSFNFPNTESSLVYTKPQRPLTANTFVTFQTTQVPENRPFISQSQTNPPSTLTAWHNAQEFTPKSSTVYQEIQNAQPMSHNQNVQSSDPSRHYNGIPNQSVTQSYQQPLQTDSVKQIAEALAKVTQLQRLPQAKPDIFTGEGPHTKFFIWETAFDALIDTAPVSAQQKLYLLYQHLGGKAKLVVEQLQYMVGADPDTAYREARNKLRNRFGRPDIIATEFETKLTNWPKIAPNDGKGLREFSYFLYQVQVASAHMSALKIYEFPSKIQSLVEKLPGWFATKWSIKVQALQQERGYSAFPSFSDLVTEVCFHAERMNIPQLTPTKHSSTPTPIQTHRKPQERIHNVLLTKTEAQKKEALVKHTEKKVCPYHNNAASHNLTECKRFKELPYEERLEFLKSNGLCFKCTGKHFRKDCEETPPRCEACNKNHLTLLHEDRSAPAKPAPPSPPEASATCTQVCGGEGTGRSCARIVLVNLTHESQPHKKQLTYAVLDDQSTDVFITDSLSRLLGITAPELDLKVNTIVGFNTIRTKKITGLRIQDIKNEHAHVRIPYAYTREYIPAAQTDIASPEVAKQWTHLAPIADQIAYRPDIEIGLLIGRNVPAAFQPTEVIAGSPEEPWAEKYKFGWTVIGRVCKDRDDDVTARVNCVTVEREVLLEHNASSHTTVQPPFVRTTPVQRSLGTYWCIESDTLGFRIELRDKPLTRRGILSTVSSVYDPLGAVSPVILTGKQILQELCSTHTDWDEPLPEDIRPRWEKWRTELPLLENLKFPRCLKPSNFGTLTSTQVCNFSDACHNGIGQVSYLRMVNEKGEVHVSFLMAKSRVAPLKQITIPRLELTAAVISVNVSSMVELELDLQPTPQRLYYTDSEIVLGYLNNDARRFHVYVGNRVQHIRDQSEPEQWYHVPGKENPADEASRGMTAAQLIENKRWFSGPQFLYENPTPSNQKPSSQLDPDDAELRKEVSVLSTSTTMHTQYLDTKHFSHSSSLLRLKHAIVRIQRMIERLRPNKTHNWRPTNGASTVKELWEAEKCLFKTAQATTFENEIDTLQRMKGNNSKFEDRKSARDRNNIIKATSNIYKLDPFIDDEGLLRVGGRLRNAEEEYQLKHPLILPKDHHVTTAMDGQHKCFERPVHKLIMLLARED